MMEAWHYSGSGNTFVMIDDRLHEFDLDTWMSMAPVLCDRSALGLPPAEGVLVLRDTGMNRLRADFLNPDGSYGAMCGNGARAVTRFAIDRGMRIDPDADILLTLSGERYAVRLHEDDTIEVDFPAPRAEEAFPVGTLEGIDVAVYYVDVKSDHAVVDADPATFNPATLRHHMRFPRGVNVNMVQIIGGVVHLATFERGVEAITGACGTGALSTALTLWRQGRQGDAVYIVPPSGRALEVTIHHDGATVTGLSLRGDALEDADPTTVDMTKRVYV